MNATLLSAIADALFKIPGDLEISDMALAKYKSTLQEQTDALDVAKTNTMLEAPDGKNETERKLLREKAISENSVCLFSRKVILETQDKIAAEEATNAKLRRMFAANCHLAELESARMYLMAKGATRA